MTTELVLDLPSELHAIEETVDYVVRRCVLGEAVPSCLNLNLRVGLTEALANAILYGNGHDPQKRVRLEIAFTSDQITARITDQGNGFDPSALPDPTAPENLQRPNGRGVFLMRQLMDEVHFNNPGNSVTLVLRVTDEVEGLLAFGHSSPSHGAPA